MGGRQTSRASYLLKRDNQWRNAQSQTAARTCSNTTKREVTFETVELVTAIAGHSGILFSANYHCLPSVLPFPENVQALAHLLAYAHLQAITNAGTGFGDVSKLQLQVF